MEIFRSQSIYSKNYLNRGSERIAVSTYVINNFTIITPFLLMIFKNLKQNKPASFSVWHSHSILVGTVYDALQREKFSFMMNFILLNCIMDDA